MSRFRPENLRPAVEVCTRKSLAPQERWVVKRRDGWRCVDCGGRRSLTVDHIYPRSRGGSNDAENLQTLCAECHAAKNQALGDLGRKVQP